MKNNSENEEIKTHKQKYNDLVTSTYDSDSSLDFNLDEIETPEIGDKTMSLMFEDIQNFVEEDKENKEDTIKKIEKDKLKSEDSAKEIEESKFKDSTLNDEKTLSKTEEISYNLGALYNDKNDFHENKSKENKKLKLWQKILVLLICLGLFLCSVVAFLLYGPYPNFREWLITTAMTTMNHQYLAKWFYSDETINSVLKKNYVVESGEEADINQVKFIDYSNINIMYKNKYEKEILTKDEGNDLYKLINISGSGIRGYLVVIYDPSKVKIATATNMNSYGEMLTDMVKKNNAIIGMNASGFQDPNYNGNGGSPHGMVIKGGKIVSNLEKPNVGGGIIGFTKDNKLILGKISANEALKKGVRDAVEFGPYLIVNGKPSFIKGNGGWGTAPRSAIGQRQDGIVLFLVMDGRDYSHGIDGVGMVELTEILMKYGAYNASNLDGGTSSGLVINGKLVNKPINSSGQQKTRKIPDAWIVTK